MRSNTEKTSHILKTIEKIGGIIIITIIADKFVVLMGGKDMRGSAA